MESKERMILVLAACLIVIALAFAFVIYDYRTKFSNYELLVNNGFDKVSDDMNKVVDSVNDNNRILTNNVQVLYNYSKALDTKIIDLTTALSSELTSLNQNLDLLDRVTAEGLNTLSTKIQDVDQKSQEEIDKLHKELANIDGDFSSFITDLYPAIVSIRMNNGQGSGFFVRNNGYIATNWHVVEKAEWVKVVMADGSVQDATLIGYNEDYDIAVLQISGDNFMDLQFGDYSEIKPGQKVVAIGNPLGLSYSLTQGIISALNRQQQDSPINYIQTDTPINPGNSGGPMINADGKVVGIATAIYKGTNSIGFAIPSNQAESAINNIITNS